MGYIIDDLRAALDDYNSKMEGELDELHRCKREVQELKNQIAEISKGIKFVRDDNMLIISAPKIMIGNVDPNGVLYPGGSEVTLRASNISLEGTGGEEGRGGSIRQRAASISTVAVDPGIDGKENVLLDESGIVFQARGITLQSEESEAVFVEPAPVGIGLTLNSDTSIDIHATPANKTKKVRIDDLKGELSTACKDVKKDVDKCKKDINKIFDNIAEMLEESYEKYATEEAARTNHVEIRELQKNIKGKTEAMVSILNNYLSSMADYAELKRREKALDEIKTALDDNADAFEKDSESAINTNISLHAETVDVAAMDGDGNLRTNDAAGMSIQMPSLRFDAVKDENTLLENGFLKVNAQTIELSTADDTVKKDDAKNGDKPAKGDVKITTKTFTVQAIDNELKDGKIEEKALTADSKITFRAQAIGMDTTDTEGNSSGSIALNAKDIKVASINVDKEKRTDKELAKDSQMLLLSDKMFVGKSDKDNTSQLVQVGSDKVAVFATTTAELQQGEAKAVVTLDGGNVTLGGDKVELKGDTTIGGKADIKGETKAPVGKFDNLEAGSSFKSPNISDGMGAGGGGSAEKPEAKLKEEEVKKNDGGNA
ncbi:MAG: hypothetical protein ACI3YZ_10760 [Prevotella sp.]